MSQLTLPVNRRVQARMRGRRRLTAKSIVIPIKLKLRAGQHDDVIDFFHTIPEGGRAAAVVQLARAYLTGETAGMLTRPATEVKAAVEDEIYATLKDLL